MSLQNRVNPSGELISTDARGTMMGNRGGRFHRDDQTLGKRRWASTHWICCELEWKDAHHEPMGQGYTSLFFLDEVTALAAGHRPCFYCRRQEAKKFMGAQKVNEFDGQLHTERLTARNLHQAVGDLPQGTIFEIDSNFYALKNQRLLMWSFSGYTKSIALTHGKVLTPPSIIANLAAGYTPRWHESAHKWD